MMDWSVADIVVIGFALVWAVAVPRTASVLELP